MKAPLFYLRKPLLHAIQSSNMLKLQNEAKNPGIPPAGDGAVTYSIRPMVKEDLGQVTAIDREAFPTQWPPANYRQELENRLAHYIVACDDSRTADEAESIQPSVMSSMSDWLRTRFGRNRPANSDSAKAPREYIIGFSGIWVMADEAHITNIAVRQEYQGKGFGELLLIATIDLARQLNASMMTLEVRASNTVAQNLYGKYGFANVGTRRGYYMDNREDAVIMTAESITSEPFQEQIQQLRESLTKKLY